MLSENDLELLSAYLDGALTEAERAALETRLQTDAELRRELARLRATVELVKSLPTLSAPRPLTLTPRMVRRPMIWMSASFSALSAAAAVILLVIGAVLFTTPGSLGSSATTAAVHQVALLPPSVDLFAATASEDQAAANGGGSANSPQITSQKQATPQSQDGQIADALRFASPTETVAAPLAFSVAQPSDTVMPLVEQGYSANAQEAVPNLQSDTDQAVAPSAMSGIASAAQQAPQPAVPMTSTPAPTLTPSSTDTSTNTPTSLPTATATLTAAPTLTPLPALQETTSPQTSTEGVGLIVVALILLAIAGVTTFLRRKAR